MLTDKEQEWLTARKKACTRCGKVPSRCSQDQRNGCYRTGLPVWDLRTTVPFYAFRDAAEFEARVSRRLAVIQRAVKPLPSGGGYKAHLN